jgi:hypothetical protein
MYFPDQFLHYTSCKETTALAMNRNKRKVGYYTFLSQGNGVFSDVVKKSRVLDSGEGGGGGQKVKRTGFIALCLSTSSASRRSSGTFGTGRSDKGSCIGQVPLKYHFRILASLTYRRRIEGIAITEHWKTVTRYLQI